MPSSDSVFGGLHCTLFIYLYSPLQVYADTKHARSKASHRTPAGLLQLLPVPHRPWSHIAMDSPQPSRPPTCCCFACIESMVSRWTLCRTGALSSVHRFGELSALLSGPPPASRLAITPRPTGRWSGQIRTWRLLCAVFLPDTRSLGPLIYPGWNMLTTL